MGSRLKHIRVGVGTIIAFTHLFYYCDITAVKQKNTRNPGSGSALISLRSIPGRLGDQIVFYAAAKWYSWHWNIPFLSRPSKHLSDFILDIDDVTYVPEIRRNFESHQIVGPKTKPDPEKSILYQLPFGRACARVYDILAHANEYRDFLTRLRQTIKVKYPVDIMALPKDAITVAVHVRKGSGWDQNFGNLKKLFPDKFLPDRYYIEQIKKVSEYFKDQPLYVYLFTDYADATVLKKYYESALSDKNNIVFACNTIEQAGDRRVRSRRLRGLGTLQDLYGDAYVDTIIRDLYSMASFDCLIRSKSHFSQSAELLGEHKIVVSPKTLYWDQHEDQVVVTSINFIVKDPAWCSSMMLQDTRGKKMGKRELNQECYITRLRRKKGRL